jgi:hypothetical protein
MAPAIFSPWGHAGPKGDLGWLSIFLNLPGIFLAGWLIPSSGDESIALFIAVVFTIQTLLLSYIVFVILRWRTG